MEKYRVGENIGMKRYRLTRRIKHQTLQRGVAYEKGDSRLFTEATENLVLLYDTSGDHGSAFRIRRELAGWYAAAGDTAGMLEVFQDGLKQARKIGDHEEICATLLRIARLFMQQGEQQRALRFFVGALETARTLKDAGKLAAILYETGLLYQQVGNEAEALRCFIRATGYMEASLEPGRDASDPAPLRGLGELLRSMLRGRGMDPYRHLRSADDACLKPHTITAAVAGIHNRNGADREAASWYGRAARQALEHGDIRVYASAAYHEALFENRLGNTREAESILAALLQVCGQHDLPIEISLATVLLVQIRLKSGSSSGSLALLQEQVDLIRRNPSIYPPESFLVFKLLGDHCRYFLKDGSAADRYYALFRKMAGKSWEKLLTY